jgi:hypothetical protein
MYILLFGSLVFTMGIGFDIFVTLLEIVIINMIIPLLNRYYILRKKPYRLHIQYDYAEDLLNNYNTTTLNQENEEENQVNQDEEDQVEKNQDENDQVEDEDDEEDQEEVEKQNQVENNNNVESKEELKEQSKEELSDDEIDVGKIFRKINIESSNVNKNIYIDEKLD